MMSENDSTAGVCVKPLEVTGVEIDLDDGKLFLNGPNYLTSLASITRREMEGLPEKLRALVNAHRDLNGYGAIIAA